MVSETGRYAPAPPLGGYVPPERGRRLSVEERDALRALQVEAIPSWYSPWAHLGVPAAFGLGLIALCITRLRDLSALELLTIPFVLLLSNAVEWRAHRYVLHKRTWYLPVLYDRHTPMHHMVYITEDMAMRSRRE